MADKVQNIVINYKFNTAEAERATQITNRAQQATDNLRKSAENFSNRASAGNRRVGNDIDAMRTKLAQLKAQIELTNRADTARLNSLIGQYKQLKGEIDKFSRSLNETQKQATPLTQQFGQLYSAIRLVVTAGIAKEVLDLSINMARLAGNVEGVTRAFRNLPNSTLLLKELQESTHGALTDFELMQRALQAQNFRIPLEQMGTLLEFASLRAQQTGQSIDYLVNSIVFGLGFQSIRRLDNVGLSAAELKGIMDELGVSLNEAFGIIVQREIQRMGGYIETSADSANRLVKEFKELKIELAQAFSNSAFLNFLQESLQGLRLLVRNGFDYFKIRGDVLRQEQQALALQDVQRIKQRALSEEFAGDAQRRKDFIQQEINSRVQLIGRYNDQINSLKQQREALQATDVANIKARDNLLKQISAWELNRGVIEEVIKLLFEYRQSLDEATGSDLTGLVERQRLVVEGLSDAIEKATTKGELADLNRQLILAEAKLQDLLKLGDIKVNLDVDVKTLGPFIQRELIQPFVNAQGEIVRYKETVVNNIRDADKQLVDYSETIKRVEEGIRRLANLKIPTPNFEVDNITFFDELGEEFLDNWQSITSDSTDILTNFINDATNVELDNYNRRLDKIRNFYDEQIKLAGDNERAKEKLSLQRDKKEEELRRKAFQKEKKAQKELALIHAAAAIVKVFVTASNYYEALIQAALIAGETALQIDNINRARYATGVIDLKGPGTTTSDSIPARLSRGESVMTAKETANSKGVLTDIRNKKFDDKQYKKLLDLNAMRPQKIDEALIKSLRLSESGVSSTLDDSKILAKLDEVKNAFPDIEDQHGILFRVETKGKMYKRRIRSKSI